MSGWRKRTIMEMAREAGFEGCAELTWENVICTEELEAFAALVREDALAQPEQEPVAWTAEQLKILNFMCGAGEWDGLWFDQKHPTKNGAFWWRSDLCKLFTTPPASQRTWVGLTDEELNEAMHYWSDKSRSSYGGAFSADDEYVDMISTWRYIESKLKEKNT
jgi:hypothetical protein